MFKDKKFSVKYTVDKRGRPINQTSTENLRKYYDISSSEEDSEIETPTSAIKSQKKKKTKKKKKVNANDKSSNDVDADKQSTEDSDNCFSSNGELLRIKPKSDDNDDEDIESEDTDIDEAHEENDFKTDVVANEKQLHIRRKNENTKLTKEVKEKLKNLSINYARGEGVLLTDSSSDEESSQNSEEEEAEIEHDWGELDRDADTTEEVTHRLALCNMDWDRIRATDLMILFHSFLPSGGLIRSITIYPSEFGVKRMKEEEISGPIELTQVQDSDKDLNPENDNEEGSEYHMEKLRQYQLNRLKYYYAVLDFDSPGTANKIYTECDGIEYESTATKLDLRFIPDDMTFDQSPKEVCKEMPELSKYQPRQFTTTALQQVKVELTWDETNPERQELTQKLNCGKVEEINDNDIQAYLASGTSDSDSETNNERKSLEDKIEEDKTNADPIEKYKALLKAIEEKEEEKQKKDVELEFTWGLGVKEKTEKLMKEKMKKEEQLTPFEQYLEKRKAKKKARKEERKKHSKDDEESSVNDENLEDSDDVSENDHKMKPASSKKKITNTENGNTNASDEEIENQRLAELELLLMDENDAENKQHFNMKKIEENASLSKSKQKRLKKKNQQENAKEDDFEVNVKDPRFAALFTSHHFNIDPADPRYRKTKGTEALVNEKLKRRADDDITDEVKTKQPKKNMKLDTELQSLVKSVKRKVQNISQPIK
ncbi:hypothetical protein KM043_018138 [Ampulex compressa]|nr:hypothetical protein KM043_018138 [Ampulex compressa]